MSVSKSLVLFKPDVYEKTMADEIDDALGHLPLTRTEHFRVRFTPDGVFELWPRIYGWRWTQSLMTDLPKVPLDVRVFEGYEAADVIIEFKDTLRAERSRVNSYRNLLHSPDDQPSF